MTNNDRNVRTLIVCFVLLILALVPLRFVEINNQMANRDVQVLGEQTNSEIVLPNAEVSADQN
jgi:hypothetical protein